MQLPQQQYPQAPLPPDPPPRPCPTCKRPMQFLRAPSIKSGEYYCEDCHVSTVQGKNYGRDYD